MTHLADSLWADCRLFRATVALKILEAGPAEPIYILRHGDEGEEGTIPCLENQVAREIHVISCPWYGPEGATVCTEADKRKADSRWN